MPNVASEKFLKDSARFIEDVLIERKSKNASYSATAFARDLGISQAYLSLILNGKRSLSLEQKLRIGEKLGLNRTQPKEASVKQFELLGYALEHEKILKYWYHFAIIALSQSQKLMDNSKAIARTLDLSELEVRSAINRLLDYGYLTKEGKYLKKTKLPFIIDSRGSSDALRGFHQARLEGAAKELTRTSEEEVAHRHFETVFVPTNRANVNRAKMLIEKFEKELIEVLMANNPDEVFQLSLQLFTIESKK